MPPDRSGPGGWDEKIGKILGIIEPIPGHITALFQKIEQEARDRIDGDSHIKSDVRSLAESAERLEQSLETLREEFQQSGDGSRDELEQLEIRINPFIDSLRDVSRVLEMKEGKSDQVLLLSKRVSELETLTLALKGTNTFWKSGFVFIGTQILTVIVALVTAYILVKLGLVKP